MWICDAYFTETLYVHFIWKKERELVAKPVVTKAVVDIPNLDGQLLAQHKEID